jgi:serine/threonine-protein kinase SRPK3
MYHLKPKAKSDVDQGAQIWDLYENKHLFYGIDPTERRYLTRAHLAELVTMLGPPPIDMLERGARSTDFFDGEGENALLRYCVKLTEVLSGNWIAEIDVPQGLTLETSEENLHGEKKEEFLQFVRCMLQWRPEDRLTAKELLEHPWMRGNLSAFPTGRNTVRLKLS